MRPGRGCWKGCGAELVAVGPLLKGDTRGIVPAPSQLRCPAASRSSYYLCRVGEGLGAPRPQPQRSASASRRLVCAGRKRAGQQDQLASPGP